MAHLPKPKEDRCISIFCRSEIRLHNCRIHSEGGWVTIKAPRHLHRQQIRSMSIYLYVTLDEFVIQLLFTSYFRCIVTNETLGVTNSRIIKSADDVLTWGYEP